jgi:DNA-directed RNA polymerase specialized sigma subunit
MSEPRIPNIQEGKLIKEIDFQILMCREKIRSHEKSIEKIMKMAGMNGPAGITSINYSGMPKAGFSHMDFPDAFMLIAKDNEYIQKEKQSIKELKRRKRNLIKMADKLAGTEQSIFVIRVIHGMTQDEAAISIGISVRQLQRIEKQMRDETRAFEI